MFTKSQPHRIKPLLYVFRVVLTGILLVQEGQLEANLLRLNEHFQLPYIQDLIERKLAGPEQGRLDESDYTLFEKEYLRLRAILEQAPQTSPLPEQPRCRMELNDLLVRIRLGQAIG